MKNFVAVFLLFIAGAAQAGNLTSAISEHSDIVEVAIRTGFASALIVPEGQNRENPDFSKPAATQIHVLELRKLKEFEGKKCSLLDFMLVQDWVESDKKIIVDDAGRPVKVSFTITSPACEGGKIPTVLVSELLHKSTIKKLEGRK